MTKLYSSKFLAIDNKGFFRFLHENKLLNFVEANLITVRQTREMLRPKKS